MKNIYKTLIFILTFSIPVMLFAQIDNPVSNIKTIARYSKKGVELRWIPDNPTILKLSFKNSFAIERSEGNSKFIEIATLKTLSDSDWISLIQNERDTTVKSDLELAMDFELGGKDSIASSINFDEGLADMREKKSKEDFTYGVLLLTALKDSVVARVLALGYTDVTAIEGKTYNYRVRLNAKSDIYEIKNGEVSIVAKIKADAYKNEVYVTSK